ncbi:Domain of unknown function DUF1080 [Fimbriimonadaceae bacterium]
MLGLLASLVIYSPQFVTPPAPQRPRDIWVFRSVLDQRARIVTLALNEKLWVAYDATNCGLYKAWAGGVKFDGAVYTASHGPQPTSEGARYESGIVDQPVWFIEQSGQTMPAPIRYRGYRMEDKQCVLQYEIPRPGKASIRIEETPEYYNRNDRTGFIRQFKVWGLTDDLKLKLKTRVESIANKREFISQGDFKIVSEKEVTVNGEKQLVIDGELLFERNEEQEERARAANGGKPGPTLNHLVIGFIPAPTSVQKNDEILFAGPASLPQEPVAGRIPGVAVRVYDVGIGMSKVPVLVAAQTPNKSYVLPVVDLKSKDDFGGFEENFIVHISGFLNVKDTGKFKFRLGSDDGSNLYIRDTMVVNHDGLHSFDYNTGEFTLDPGEHPFRIEYFQGGADATLRLEWQKPGSTTWELIPASAFTTIEGEVRVTSPGRKNVIVEGNYSRPGDQRPLEGVHPSYDLITIRPKDFKPRVGGIAFLPTGEMLVCTWDADGAVYKLSGIEKGAESVKVTQIAKGLAEPLGLTVVGKDIYVLQKQELTKLVDRNGDGVTDEYFAVANGWGVTDNFHEFAFGLVYKDGYFYANLATAINPGGASTQPQNPDRGKVVKINAKTGDYELVAHGLRTPNGIGFGYKGEIFIADNQGDWLPSSKILHYKPGAFFGSRSVDPIGTKGLKEQPPVVWLPQGEIGNSPSNPTTMNDGPYKGQMLHGDVTHGGVKRVSVEQVNGVLQGAVYRFTQGLEAGVNRIAWGPDGALYIGGIGAAGNWGQEGKERFGLQKIKFNGKSTFEILATRAKTNGFELELTQPLAEFNGNDAADYTVQTWHYVPTEQYGGPKVDTEVKQPKSITVSKDRKKVFVELDGLKAGNVVYFRLDPTLLSKSGENLWSTEAWYTLNEIPQNATVKPNPAKPVTGLSDQEKKEGFELLFDGKSLSNWIGFRQKVVPTGWKAVNGEIRYVPGSGGGGDLRTLDTFGDFDFRWEWKVGPGGNSGMMYRSTEEYTAPYITGPEYQLLDNLRHNDGRSPMTSAGSVYAIYPTDRAQARAAGQWNSSRVVARGNSIEHWLNGKKVASYVINSADWKDRVLKSKFANAAIYGQRKVGNLVFQDHGDPVALRNIRIKRLK